MNQTGCAARQSRRIGAVLLSLWMLFLLAGCAFPWETPKTPEEAAAEFQISASALPWNLQLVNRYNPVEREEEPELTELANGQNVDSRMYPDLQQMFDDARASGVYPTVAAGYRTREKQQSLMDERVAEYLEEGCSEKEAKALAAEWVAKPGTSEHELGLAVDINADGIHSAGYEVYDWLARYAWEYGFICRYPEDKTEITGVSSEPWHYRYVGLEAAAEMYETGECLEEYLLRRYGGAAGQVASNG